MCSVCRLKVKGKGFMNERHVSLIILIIGIIIRCIIPKDVLGYLVSGRGKQIISPISLIRRSV